MKFNWGTGIVITAVLFMSYIVVLVVKTYKHKVDLVSEDYYAQELRFQERIDRMNNVKESDKVVWRTEGEEIVFQFPEQNNLRPSGTIEFFRPSDPSKDRTFSIQSDQEGKQRIGRNLLTQGLYKIKIDWISGETGYYMEEDIYIP